MGAQLDAEIAAGATERDRLMAINARVVAAWEKVKTAYTAAHGALPTASDIGAPPME
jgi:hypothetical protein